MVNESLRRQGAKRARRARRFALHACQHYEAEMHTSASGFIEPCLPMISRTVPTGADWAYEIKHDGFRFICRREGERVRCYSRGGHDWSGSLPAVVEAMRAFPVTSVGACTKRAPPLFRKSKSLENENIVCVRRRPYGPKSFYLAAAIRCTTDGIAPIKKLRGCVRVTGADRTRPRC